MRALKSLHKTGQQNTPFELTIRELKQSSFVLSNSFLISAKSITNSALVFWQLCLWITIINGVVLKIYKLEDIYYTELNYNGYNFDIETSKITEQELATFLLSILK